MIQIKVDQRGKRFYLSSDEIPGLWLWGKDLEQLQKDLIPTVKYLYKANKGIDIQINNSDFCFVHTTN